VAAAAVTAAALGTGQIAVALDDRTPVTLTVTLLPANAATLAAPPSRSLDAGQRLVRLRSAAPTAAADQRARRWLTAHGLTVTADDGWSLTLSAPVDVAARAFGTSVTRTPDGWSASAPAQVPAELAGVVQSVVGLDTTARLQQHTTLDRSMFLDGGDLRSAYAAPASNGAGSTVASVQFSGWDRRNLCTFVTSSNAPTYNRTLPRPRFADAPSTCGAGANGALIDTRPVDGFNPWSTTGGNQSLEVALDQEALLAVAPLAGQRIYFAQNNTTGWVAAFSRIAADAEADVAAAQPTITAVSVSWGMCELAYGHGGADDPIPAWEQQIQRITALGIPIFAATGDGGSYDCTSGALRDSLAVDFPASSPEVVAVGGTSLTESSPGKRDWTEKAWGPATTTSRHPIAASGGGASARFPAPAYQVASGATDSRRTIPDIASSADGRLGLLMYGGTWRNCGLSIRWCGAWLSAGGTSSGAPVQAGLFADAMATFGATRPNVGSLHDLLYGNPDAIRDITSGTGGRLLATKGYDGVTGLGVPDWNVLVQRLALPSVEVPRATRNLTVPVRVVDLVHPAITGYSIGENLTVCPAGPDRPDAPTSFDIADGADRTVHLGVCVFHDGTSTLVTRDVTLDRQAPTVAPHLRLTRTTVQARWDARDPGGSGAVTYAVLITRASDGATVWRGTRELPYLTLAFRHGTTYRIRASAVDAAGNHGPTVTSAVLRIP
ncbi:MAG: kumamolisin, partial [Frankiaceae bacterium]|nr:kumamolisin [Frankiaceae bacterium]